MKSQQERLSEICKSTLGRLKGPDDCWVDCIGPHMIGMDSGQIDMGWTVMVTLRNPLLGRAPLAVSLGLSTILPPDGAFEAATGMCLERAREERDRNVAKAEAEAKAAIEAAAEGDTEPVKLEVVKPKGKPRERESHFASKPGSGFTDKGEAA